jgi:hypothetical protein
VYNVNFVIADALVDEHKIQQTYAAAASGMVAVTRHSRRSGGRGKKYIFLSGSLFRSIQEFLFFPRSQSSRESMHLSRISTIEKHLHFREDAPCAVMTAQLLHCDTGPVVGGPPYIASRAPF